MNNISARFHKKDPVEKNGYTYLGVASCLIDESFVIHGIRVHKKDNKIILDMPSRKINDKWVNICHPISKEAREQIEKAVTKAYEEALGD